MPYGYDDKVFELIKVKVNTFIKYIYGPVGDCWNFLFGATHVIIKCVFGHN